MNNQKKFSSQLNAGFEQLLERLPNAFQDFSGTDFGQPAALAYLGKKADAEGLRTRATGLRLASPETQCEVAAVMAEMIEAAAPDHDKYFQTDAKTRGHVFSGSKWRSGWVFIIGGGDHSELAQKFGERNFLVFAQNGSALKGAIDLGPRETATVYFLQVMARYAMIWGQIKPGDDHEMGHFLEKDLPGVVVADGRLTPIEELLLLAIMKLGAPAVVPEDYPWDLGRQVRAAGAVKIVEAAVKFPNLRVKDIQGKTIELPVFCNPANIKAEFTAEGTVGGANSFFQLRPAEVESGIEFPASKDLKQTGDIGILVEIGDPRLDISTSEYLEKDAVKGIACISGLRAEQPPEGGFRIHYAAGVSPDAALIAEALQKWIVYEFPYLESVKVSILTEEAASRTRDEVEAFRQKRRRIIEGESDDNVDSFNYCIECQPFSKDHVCIVTPDRPPMCGRDRFQIKSAALFGASWHPWKRRDLAQEELRGSIPRGIALDELKGEYQSVNETVKRVTPSNIERVQLHGLRECPHTSCGCFQYLVFWIKSLNGLGIMERDYPGEGPEGLTWNKLANAAGGKQTPGIAGVSRNYLRSKRFMQGEGGLAAVRWVSPKAFEALKDLFLQPSGVQVGEK